MDYLTKLKSTASNTNNFSNFKFDRQHTYENRLDESNRILSKYPDRIPIIVEPSSGCKLTIDKCKYLVPMDLTIGQFIYVIRKRLKMGAEKALFVFVGGTIPSSTSLVSTVYDEHKSKDNFLKIHFSEENTFGN